MRIVIDLQGAQGSNRNRGIGRYAEALALAICQNQDIHDIHLVLNNSFCDSIELFRATFNDFISQSNIHVWNVFTPSSEIDAQNADRRQFNEAMREAFIGQLCPDVILVTSLFEGLVDDVVTSVKSYNRIPTAVVLYDLIPYINRRPYLENPVVESWYYHKIDHLKRADLLLAISASSGQEAVDCLGFESERVVNISTACDSQFKPLILSQQDYDYLMQQYGIAKSFVMYTGGIDHRKNIEGLIRAFAALPIDIRQQHQLVIVCSVQDPDRRRLMKLAQEQGLSSNDYIMTGFVPEVDLIKLYNACKLFIFPSWHEGFGLPALEAMQCGRPVIASSNSSLPEVIGNPEALFDSHDEKSITAKLLQSLTDDNFRAGLAKHGLKQAKKFNWNTIAQRTITALEHLHANRMIPLDYLPVSRPRLAYLSPLPPERSGISDYSAELLEELTRWYQVDVIVNQPEVSDAWIKSNCPIRTVEWFKANSHQFERVLYHFGNSEFHQHMFGLLETIPGVVALHDFFLSGIQNYRDAMGWAAKEWKKNLYHSHGYKAVWQSENESYPNEAIWHYPVNLKVIQDALGIIVHSENSLKLANTWYGQHVARGWKTIPLLRTFPTVNNKRQARVALGIDEDSFLICSFGLIGKTKQNLRVVEAFINSKLATDENCYLVFVGQQDPTEYGVEIEKLIVKSKMTKRISITGWADSERFKLYLQAADAGVQLRTLSRGETSATVLDCMNYGLATIVNANGSMADLDPCCVYMLPDEFSNTELVTALETVYENKTLQATLSQNAVKKIKTVHSPRRCAALYAEAIEEMYAQQQQGFLGLINNVQSGQVTFEQNNPDNLRKLANNFPAAPALKQIFVDVSELAVRDARSGIQRVVRSILRELLNTPPLGYRIEPVFATQTQHGYFYARKFTCEFLGISDNSWAVDQEIDYSQGDIFIGLDLQPHVASAQKNYIAQLKNQGVKVSYVVYDLLAILQSQHFVDGAFSLFTDWLRVVTTADQLVCISKAVANETYDWLQAFGIKRGRPLTIDWFHLGADIDSSVPTRGMPKDSRATLSSLKAQPTFLMVGTIEPRKGHQQVLEAFDLLWQSGFKNNLVIVGKIGWKVGELVDQIQQHKEFGKQLFWLESISDEYLEAVYASSSCLIAASYGEGFGLPLIEAAQHDLPIIARDIPVFREVAGSNAVYFEDSVQPEIIAQTVKNWLKLYMTKSHPTTKGMFWLTWADSTKQLLNAVLNSKSSYLSWQGTENMIFWGNDPRLYSQTGKRIGKQITTINEAGFLIYGPYQPMKAGTYQVSVKGSWQHLTGNEFIDMAYEQGTQKIYRSPLSEALNKSDSPIEVIFTIGSDISDFELRVWVEQNTQLTLSEITIDVMKPDSIAAKDTTEPPSTSEHSVKLTQSNSKSSLSTNPVNVSNPTKTVNNGPQKIRHGSKRRR